MDNLWSDEDARAAVAHYAGQGVGEDLALRVYTTRLLGGEPRLVQHGGGNTSVKTELSDLTGGKVSAMCVKGSGWDMASIEPPGLPAMRLEAVRPLLALEALSDEDMVNAQRGSLLDSAAPNPSVEALLHAFLPHKFIDHTHAAAVLALTDQPDGAELCAEVYGERAALVPYVMPGFALAKKAREVADANPNVEGLILLKHGIFSFGETAREAYDRMIALVSAAEARIEQAQRKIFAPAALPDAIASAADVAPILRGLASIPEDAADGRYKRWIVAHRASPAILDYVGGEDVGQYSQVGVVTPDHAIRTKGLPLLVPVPEAGKLDVFKSAAADALTEFERDYAAYFDRQNGNLATPKTRLDTVPRVILVPGLGLFALGKSAKDAAVAADLAETTIKVITDAEAVGRFETIDEADLFDIEYWSLEQAKLGKGAEKPLARHVVLVTGGAGAIGAATAGAFAAQGAAVAVADLDGNAASAVASEVGGIGLACDVTDTESVRQAFDTVCETYGGIDIVVSNAGAAWQDRIGEVSDAVLRQSFELNFFAHQTVAQNAVRVMEEQGTGGVLLFNASKQAVNPGRDFGPYGLPKAATLFLARQYALDYGDAGIRSNAVNADRIRGGLLTEDMITERAKARGLSEEDYMGGNLLGREVTADDVAQAFVSLALARKTTGATLTVDGGNIAAALR
jgi:rhamnose utilization protein RhaD (predicted bifunctional aldolase and dehydrogenase)/NAD(P)-dependent dehydrogenase (short-subunit alcohol dehydrogenase family)